MTAISLVLADDHPIVLRGLSDLFSLDVGFTVVATCRDGAEALAAVKAHQPDVLLLDLRLPVLDGLAVLKALAEDGGRTRTVLLTAFLDERTVAEAIRFGVAGIVLKDSAPSVLIECLRRVRAGGTWFDPDLLASTLQRTLRREMAEQQVSEVLTPREIEIVRMVAEGLRNKDIAARLRITEGTVKIHLHHIYTKLAVDGRVDLVRYAHRSQLL